MTTPICTACNDTHRMWMSSLERTVPCTFCPVPCAKCNTHKPLGAYCKTTPCSCECHTKHYQYAQRRAAQATP